MTPEDEGVEEKALMLCFRCKSLPQAPEFGPWPLADGCPVGSYGTTWVGADLQELGLWEADLKFLSPHCFLICLDTSQLLLPQPGAAPNHAFHVMRTVPSDCERNRLFLPCVVSRQIFGHGNGKNNEVAIGSQHSLSNLGNSSWLWETDRGIQRNWWRMSPYMDIWNSECSKIQHFLNAGSKSPHSKTCIWKQWDATSREGYSTHGDARSRH